MNDYDDVLVTLDDALFDMVDNTLSDLAHRGIAIDSAVIEAVANSSAQRLAKRMREIGESWISMQRTVDSAAVPE